ncbi:MAG: LptA/OstA family protein [Erythrobacter sp.]|jgi:lipopolysaccharide export system protein LptA|nr:LptA/OstA family protein [Erythrobacter sp.]
MTTRRTHLSRTALAWSAAGFLGTIALMGGISGHAQSIANHNSRAPVNYAADRIELQDRANRVVLSGGVVIDQAGLTMRAARTIVSYDDSGELRIDRITATGGVVVTRGNERASGSTAIYDFNRRVITMAGDVSLRRGTDTLNGGRLVIDLASGLSSVDGRASGAGASGAPGGRVSGSFQVPQED